MVNARASAWAVERRFEGEDAWQIALRQGSPHRYYDPAAGRLAIPFCSLTLGAITGIYGDAFWMGGTTWRDWKK